MGIEELSNYITIDRGIRFGKPCIKGTRIAVGDILQWQSGAYGIIEKHKADDRRFRKK